MKKVINIMGEYIEVTKQLAIQVIADEVADWVTVKMDMDYFSEGDRYFIHDGELYTEDDDAETLLEIAGYKVEWRDDLEDYDTTDRGYYDAPNMQWMK